MVWSAYMGLPLSLDGAGAVLGLEKQKLTEGKEAWLAGEHWRNEVFATHGKIYEASASQMFNVPIEEITKGSPLRQKAKSPNSLLGTADQSAR